MISTLKEVREALQYAWGCIENISPEEEAKIEPALTKLDALIVAQEKAEPVAWNKNIRDLVDDLLAQAGYAPDSSLRNALSCMNFDAAAAVSEAERVEPDMLAICAALGFDPTNHHNAAKCPYCRPPAAAAVSEAKQSDSTAELGDWEDVTADQMPNTWGEECKRYRVVCSNGFVGPFGLESALLHKPALWPQCYPNGADEDSCCTLKTQRRRLPNYKAMIEAADMNDRVLAAIDALYKHGFQIQDERDTLKAESERLRNELAAMTNSFNALKTDLDTANEPCAWCAGNR